MTVGLCSFHFSFSSVQDQPVMRIHGTLLLAVAVASSHALGDGDGDSDGIERMPLNFFTKVKGKMIGESSSSDVTAKELTRLMELKEKSSQYPAETHVTSAGIRDFIKADSILNTLRGPRMEELREMVNKYNDATKMHRSMYYFIRKAVGEKKLVQAIKNIKSSSDKLMYQTYLISSYRFDSKWTLATLKQFEDEDLYNMYEEGLQASLKNLDNDRSLDPEKKEEIKAMCLQLLQGPAIEIKEK